MFGLMYIFQVISLSYPCSYRELLTTTSMNNPQTSEFAKLDFGVIDFFFGLSPVFYLGFIAVCVNLHRKRLSNSKVALCEPFAPKLPKQSLMSEVQPVSEMLSSSFPTVQGQLTWLPFLLV